jgi:hypothetical protein
LNKVILIGTSHPIQRNFQRTDFPEYINETIRKHGVCGIAEEIDINDSVISNISNYLNLEYKIIEPNSQERIAIGIDSLNQIEHSIFMEFNDHESLEATTECEARKQSAYRRREQEWLRRIRTMKKNPLLVVCGANHIFPFFDLLKSDGFNVIVECEIWE